MYRCSEEDYEPCSYSRFALPWLLFCVTLLAILLALTLWQQHGTVKRIMDGVPRVLQLKNIADSDTEAGVPKSTRDLRLATAVLSALGVLLAVVQYFIRPAPKLRKVGGIVAGSTLVVSGLLSWTAFGVGLTNYTEAVNCAEHYRITGETCETTSPIALAAVTLSAAIGVTALLGGCAVIYGSFTGRWKRTAASWYEEQQDLRLETPPQRTPGDTILRNVTYVFKGITTLLLLLILGCAVGLIVFTLLLHENRETEYIRSTRGRANRTTAHNSVLAFEHTGWPRSNTLVRHTAVGIGLVIFLINMLPFEGRATAIMLGFGYFVAACLLLVGFGFDVHTLRWVWKLECPTTLTTVGFVGGSIENSGVLRRIPLVCSSAPFVATAVVEFVAFLALVVYLIVEYYYVVMMRLRVPEEWETMDVPVPEVSGTNTAENKPENFAQQQTQQSFNYSPQTVNKQKDISTVTRNGVTFTSSQHSPVVEKRFYGMFKFKKKNMYVPSSVPPSEYFAHFDFGDFQYPTTTSAVVSHQYQSKRGAKKGILKHTHDVTSGGGGELVSNVDTMGGHSSRRSGRLRRHGSMRSYGTSASLAGNSTIYSPSVTSFGGVSCLANSWSGISPTNSAARHHHRERSFDPNYTLCIHCSESILQSQMEQHCRVCPSYPVKCHMCGIVICREHIRSHQAYCQLVPMMCRGCGDNFTRAQLHQHEQECDEMEVQCELCQVQLSRYQLAHHLQNECQQRMLLCVACGEAVVAMDLTSHQASCTDIAGSPPPPLPTTTTTTQGTTPHAIAVAAALQLVPVSAHVAMTQPTSSTSYVLPVVEYDLHMCTACGENFTHLQLIQHQHECAEMLVQCELCSLDIPRYHLSQHVQVECAHKLILCDMCGDPVFAMDWAMHQGNCQDIAPPPSPPSDTKPPQQPTITPLPENFHAIPTNMHISSPSLPPPPPLPPTFPAEQNTQNYHFHTHNHRYQRSSSLQSLSCIYSTETDEANPTENQHILQTFRKFDETIQKVQSFEDFVERFVEDEHNEDNVEHMVVVGPAAASSRGGGNNPSSSIVQHVSGEVPWIGMQVDLRIHPDTGDPCLLVTELDQAGPAAAGGVQPNDIVVLWEGTPVESVLGFNAMLYTSIPGDVVTLTMHVQKQHTLSDQVSPNAGLHAQMHLMSDNLLSGDEEIYVLKDCYIIIGGTE